MEVNHMEAASVMVLGRGIDYSGVLMFGGGWNIEHKCGYFLEVVLEAYLNLLTIRSVHACIIKYLSGLTM